MQVPLTGSQPASLSHWHSQEQSRPQVPEGHTRSHRLPRCPAGHAHCPVAWSHVDPDPQLQMLWHSTPKNPSGQACQGGRERGEGVDRSTHTSDSLHYSDIQISYTHLCGEGGGVGQINTHQ